MGWEREGARYVYHIMAMPQATPATMAPMKLFWNFGLGGESLMRALLVSGATVGLEAFTRTLKTAVSREGSYVSSVKLHLDMMIFIAIVFRQKSPFRRPSGLVGETHVHLYRQTAVCSSNIMPTRAAR